MRFTLEITLGNAAMQDGSDVANALDQVSAKVQQAIPAVAGDGWIIRDENGNTVGRCRFEDEI